MRYSKYNEERSLDMEQAVETKLKEVKEKLAFLADRRDRIEKGTFKPADILGKEACLEILEKQIREEQIRFELLYEIKGMVRLD